MIKQHPITIRLLAILLFLFGAITFCGCNSEAKEAQKPVEASLKGAGVQEVKTDLFLKAVDIPDKAYIGVTATWGFATREGKPQQEYVGYILKKDASGWKIEKNVSYTTDKDQARALLEGRKELGR